MTVQELIDALSRVSDKSRTVTIDGCDCSEKASAVFDEGGVLIVARADTEHLYDAQDRL